MVNVDKMWEQQLIYDILCDFIKKIDKKTLKLWQLAVGNFMILDIEDHSNTHTLKLALLRGTLLKNLCSVKCDKA